MKRIGIIGARSRDSYKDYELLRIEFDKVYEDGDIIVSGHCPQGGDRMAEDIAKELDLTEENGKLILHRPDWDKFGNGAGFVRNKFIARDSDILIAVVKKSREGGTEDTISTATKQGKEIILVPQVSIEDFDPLDEI